VEQLPADIVAADRFVFNPELTVAIEKRAGGVFQVAYVNGKETVVKRFDIAFGAGEKAWTFGYWQDKKLYQLPLSYFKTIGGWANSPGFPLHQAQFNRPIIGRCFECHASYIAEEEGQPQSLTATRTLDQQSIIYGIDCERCHGPAAEHVSFHTENPTVKEPKYMVSWKMLSRQQRLDACGVCHSGNDMDMQTSTFRFKPGDTLSNFYYPGYGHSSAGPDVHGNQVQLLATSRCFTQSKTLECGSCHNTHERGPENLAVYSAQCINCHKDPQAIHTTMNASEINAITANCIDCHMPNQASQKISFQVTGKQETDAYLLRTHRIAVYPDATKSMVEKKK